MSSVIFSFCITLLDCGVLLFYLGKIGKPRVNIVYLYVMYFVYFVFCCAAVFYVQLTPISAVVSFLGALLLAFLYAPVKTTLSAAIFYCVFREIITVTTSFFVSYLERSARFGGLFSPADFQAIASTISLICGALVAFFLCRKFKEAGGRNLPLSYWISILLIPVASVFLLFYIYGLSLAMDEVAPETVVSSSLIVLMNLLVFFFYNRTQDIYQMRLENQKLSQKVNNYNFQHALEYNAQTATQNMRHDLKNLLISLKIDLDRGKVKEAVRQIEKQLGQIDMSRGPAGSGNLVIDSTVNFKANVAARDEIKVQLKSRLLEDPSVDSYDISTLISSAMDNAIEAVRSLPREQREILVYVGCQKHTMLISVENPFDGTIETDESGSITTRKADKKAHGFGLRSMEKIAERYGGSVSISHEDNRFKVSIMLFESREEEESA